MNQSLITDHFDDTFYLTAELNADLVGDIPPANGDAPVIKVDDDILKSSSYRFVISNSVAFPISPITRIYLSSLLQAHEELSLTFATYSATIDPLLASNM